MSGLQPQEANNFRAVFPIASSIAANRGFFFVMSSIFSGCRRDQKRRSRADDCATERYERAADDYHK